MQVWRDRRAPVLKINWGFAAIEDFSEISKVVQNAINSHHELFSIIFPRISKVEELAELIAYLSVNEPFFIEKEEEHPLFENGTGGQYISIFLRIKIQQEKVSWPLVMGPFDYFSKTRQAPFVSLIFRPLPEKNNLMTNETTIGPDDIPPVVTNPELLANVFEQTAKAVAQKRGEKNQKLFRARSAVVLPKGIWDKYRP